jgi:hypothetical protein|tara:strand:- start:601 stop:843 length:243 start_codon:yes stop_codon:yes gene_type:complete
MYEIRLRLGGTNKFVSKIDPNYDLCHPIGKVDFVEGWNNPEAIDFETVERAQEAKRAVLEIEGFPTTIEECRVGEHHGSR